MKEYIDRVELNRVFDMVCSNEVLRKQIAQYIDSAPIEDVRENIHAKWIENHHESYIPVEYDENDDLVVHKYLTYKCSICGRTEKNKEPYCNCGAKMDG